MEKLESKTREEEQVHVAEGDVDSEGSIGGEGVIGLSPRLGALITTLIKLSVVERPLLPSVLHSHHKHDPQSVDIGFIICL